VKLFRKEVDDAEPEKRRTPRHKNKGKRSCFLEFPNDPASIEREAGRVADNARQMQLATCKGGLAIHGRLKLILGKRDGLRGIMLAQFALPFYTE